MGVITSNRSTVGIECWTATVDAGSWSPSTVTLRYQWYRGSKRIADATGSEFVVRESYVGKLIKVRVAGKQDGYHSAVRYSKLVRVTGCE